MKRCVTEHVYRFKFDFLYFYIFVEVQIETICVAKAGETVIE